VAAGSAARTTPAASPDGLGTIVDSGLSVRASQRTIGRALASSVARRGAVIAVQHGARVGTFDELNTASNRLANALSERGLGRGDRICVLSENRHEYAFIFYAAAKLGIAVSPPNWRLAAAELAPACRQARFAG
jgi:fatty-acyl-CoA synthase